MAIKPSKIIGTDYLHRWHLIPRNKYFNVYLHKFIGSDDDRATHDHPWRSVSFLLWGHLIEHIRSDGPFSVNYQRFVPWLRPVFRSATHSHRLEVVAGSPAWTVFITGPVRREWGFHCPRGWQHWSTMTNEKGDKIGGCE